MAFNHTLSAILRGAWALDPVWAQSHLPVVMMILKGQPVSFTSSTVDRNGNQVFEQPFVVDPVTMKRHEIKIFDQNRWCYVENPNIPKGSVGVIPLTGPITKYNGECGEPGAIQKNTWLNEMERRENISSVILLADTPGGQVSAANPFSSTIKKFSKPMLSFVDGMCGSMGMRFHAACKEGYMSSETDIAGSIGTYCTLFDFREMLEKEGIKMLEVYAPQSTDKNKTYQDALDGKEEGLKEELRVLTESFINAVKTDRPKSAKYIKEWNTGKTFYAQKAVDIGLADGILSFNQVVSRASWLSKRKN